jgi:hypothetical protein
MQEILDYPQQQEDHRDTQADQSQNTQESQLITITSIGPENISKIGQSFHDPITDLLENEENSTKQRNFQNNHLK